jgi:general secretion pathway protein D
VPKALAQDQAAVPAQLAPGDDTKRKLNTIILSLDFNNATIDEAVNFLRVESKRLDPAHKAINFVISPDAASSAKPVTFALDKVTLEEALQNVCELASVKYVVEGRAVRILALTENAANAVAGPPGITPNDKAAEATLSRLQTIVVDRINFQKLDIAAAVQFLAQKSKELDPTHRGINFVLGAIAPGDKIHREVSVTLDSDPLSDVIREIAQQTNLHYSVGDNIVTFKP